MRRFESSVKCPGFWQWNGNFGINHFLLNISKKIKSCYLRQTQKNNTFKSILLLYDASRNSNKELWRSFTYRMQQFDRACTRYLLMLPISNSNFATGRFGNYHDDEKLWFLQFLWHSPVISWPKTFPYRWLYWNLDKILVKFYEVLEGLGKKDPTRYPRWG